ncbi:hypothetical protein PRUPE_3G050600 [Prunus persica]|uniref:RNase III domain-containing protein n=1 Tax=Prunus persica TaxID=3760 RepID=A0A251PVH1_PRUPE|nr:uncharacterized protein LOC18784264 isoform X2 [Prunus persica]ONI15577.1 hypothetical protein PRUPE_3G050600 [Prunus persica]
MQTLSMASSSAMGVRVVTVRASLDTQQRLSYNRNTPRKIPKPENPSTATGTTKTPPTVTLTATTTSVFDLLKRPAQGETVRTDELYLGYERWVPSPSKVQKRLPSPPKLYVRRHFLFPPLSIEEYNDRVMAVVRCEAQDALLQKLLSDNFLSDEERNVLKWGKNISSAAKTRTKKRAGVAVYNRASSLETLVGYLYLTNMERLEEVMIKLGFSTDSSMQLISQEPEEVNGKAPS